MCGHGQADTDANVMSCGADVCGDVVDAYACSKPEEEFEKDPTRTRRETEGGGYESDGNE